MVIRDAVLEDAEAVARIYNEGIEDRIATVETDLRTAAEIEEWFDRDLPFLVLEEDGVVQAYSAGIPFSGRCAYSGVLEFSFYVARDERGKGYGSAVLRAFLEIARERGFHKVIGNLLAENAVSAGVMGRCGFREVGVYERHGVRDGQFFDVRAMEILL